MVVEDIARLLEDEAGLLVWKDNWELAGGDDWVERLPEAISRAHAMVIFVGPNGLGPWHKEKIKIGLQRATKHRLIRIIPVALPGCPEDMGLPEYLDAKHYVNLRTLDAWGIHLLCCAIVGARPGRRDQFEHSLPSAPRNDTRSLLPTVEIGEAAGIGHNFPQHCTSESVKASQLLFSLERRLKEPLENLVAVAGETLLRISRLWDEHDQWEAGEKHLRHVYYDLCESIASILASQTFWSSSENLHRRLGNLNCTEDKLGDRDALAHLLNFVMYYGGGLDNQRGIFRIWAKLRPALPVDPYELADHVGMLCEGVPKSEAKPLFASGLAACEEYLLRHKEIKVISEDIQNRLVERMEYEGYLDEKERMPAALYRKYDELLHKLRYLDGCDAYRCRLIGGSGGVDHRSHLIYLGAILATVANYPDWKRAQPTSD